MRSKSFVYLRNVLSSPLVCREQTRDYCQNVGSEKGNAVYQIAKIIDLNLGSSLRMCLAVGVGSKVFPLQFS